MPRRLALSVPLVLALATPALAAPLAPPALTYVASDRVSITVEVRAGDSGAPAGFVLEWMPAERYRALGGWPSTPGDVPSADFTGVPTLSPTASYRLQPGAAASIVLGALFDETGLESADRQELSDATEYVIRVRAAAPPGQSSGDYSGTLLCVTPARTANDCTLSQGYWDSHPESWLRVPSLAIGSVVYPREQLLAILHEPARGNGLVALAHELIATKLNMLLGALPPAAIANAMSQADALIGSKVVPPAGAGRLSPYTTRTLTWLLRAFNTGRIGPGGCTSDLHAVPVAGATWGTLKAIYR
jgi:hypothetical protein